MGAGALSIRPVPPPAYTLDSLLAGITDENLHAEADTGGPAGGEEW